MERQFALPKLIQSPAPKLHQRCRELCIRTAAQLLLVSLALAGLAAAQDWTLWQGAKGAPRLRAELWNKQQNARKHLAQVEVEVQNVWVHAPDVVPQTGVPQGVLKYQLDSCAPIVTTDTKLKFEQLKSGSHRINVSLVGMDDRPLSPPATLTLSIP